MSSLSGVLSGGYSKKKSKSNQQSRLFSNELLDAMDSSALRNLGVYDRLINQNDPRAASALNVLSNLSDNGSLDIDAIMNEAKRQSNQALGQSYQGLSRSVGATDNSLVQAAYDEAATQAATQLAGKRAELEAANAGERSDNAKALLAALGDMDKLSLSGINSLLELLKGGKTVSTGTERNSGWSVAGEMRSSKGV